MVQAHGSRQLDPCACVKWGKSIHNKQIGYLFVMDRLLRFVLRLKPYYAGFTWWGFLSRRCDARELPSRRVSSKFRARSYVFRPPPPTIAIAKIRDYLQSSFLPVSCALRQRKVSSCLQKPLFSLLLIAS